MFDNNLPLSFLDVNMLKIKKADKNLSAFRNEKAKVLKLHYIFFTFAAPGPLAPLTISNSTLSPSARVLKPSD